MDYAAPETKAIGEKLIQAELENIPKEKVKEIWPTIWRRSNRASGTFGSKSVAGLDESRFGGGGYGRACADS